MKTTGLKEAKKIYTAAKANGMNVDHILTLLHLHENGTCLVGSLTRTMKVLHAQMSRILQRLENKGFLIRSINAKDKRAFDVALTTEGEAFLEEVLA